MVPEGSFPCSQESISDHIFSHINQIHTFQLHFHLFHFNIIFPSTPVSTEWFNPKMFSICAPFSSTRM